MKFYNMMMFMVTNSPWPIFLSFSLILLCLNLIISINSFFSLFFFLNFLLIVMLMAMWWNDVILESTFLGNHNIYIMKMTIFSMILFIISEIFFFISFFWSFFHSILSPDVSVGMNWPYSGIFLMNNLNIPLFNSILLISSGCSITWSHYCSMSSKLNDTKMSLIITMILGVLFISLQMFEYKYSMFSFSDGILASVFFLTTGFHGIHVLIGMLFIMIITLRMNSNHFSYSHIMGFEFSIWYWHFVDVVWLYLYMMIYWLGS